MTIWAFNKPDEEDKISFVYDSIKKGKSRFGWSYLDSADLRILDVKEYEDCSSEELKIWDKTKFLLDIEKGDWIVHINIPKWGLCSAVKVVEPYEFDTTKNNLGKEYTDVGDFRHMISIDPNSLIVFDRDDTKIYPALNKRLKLQGKQWRIKCQNDFFKAISQLKEVNFKNVEKHNAKRITIRNCDKYETDVYPLTHDDAMDYYFGDNFDDLDENPNM